MKLKVICQICGETGTVDTEKPVGSQPRWESYRLEDFDMEEIPGSFKDYEIWICGRCMEEAAWCGEIDFEKLESKLRESLFGEVRE